MRQHELIPLAEGLIPIDSCVSDLPALSRVITLNHSNLRLVMTRLMIVIFLPRSRRLIWTYRLRLQQLSWTLLQFSISETPPFSLEINQSHRDDWYHQIAKDEFAS